MQNQYPGLEVVPSDGLIPHHSKHSQLEVRHGPVDEKAVFSGLYGNETDPLHHGERTSITHKICGLRRATFWLTLALAVTIIVAIVGGSVGGTLLLRKSQAHEAPGTTRSVLLSLTMRT